MKNPIIMNSTIQKWGNSHALRIPLKLINILDLHENDKVELTLSGDSIRISKPRKTSHKTTKERLESFYGKPIDRIIPVKTEDVYWGKPVGEEI